MKKRELRECITSLELRNESLKLQLENARNKVGFACLLVRVGSGTYESKDWGVGVDEYGVPHIWFRVTGGSLHMMDGETLTCKLEVATQQVKRLPSHAVPA